MPRVSIDDLNTIKEKVRESFALREGGNRAKVTVHMGTCGEAAGARKVMAALLDEMQQKGVQDVIVTTSGCAGFCSREPMVTVEMLNEPPVKYVYVNDEKMRKIFQEHIVGNKIVDEYALSVGNEIGY
jgi:NADP-reducing hydrogenase subunit HndB